MPSYLQQYPNIEYIAGRNFKYGDKFYEVGDEFVDNGDTKIEVLVRSRHLIPVVEDPADLPFAHRHVVKIRANAFAKLGREDPKVATAKAEHPAGKRRSKKQADPEPIVEPDPDPEVADE